ncbi:MAG: hypothetical protein PVJ27_05740 [Candidatus Brocadiaceae bacterium]|jgi:hypothetical protein
MSAERQWWAPERPDSGRSTSAEGNGMDYEETVAFRGDPDEALRTARPAFVQAGFEVSAIEDASFQATQPGMASTKGHPLLGASRVVVAVRDGALGLGADLGGVRKLRNGLIVFIGGMALAFLVGFGAFLLPRVRAGELSAWMLLVPVAPFVPWPVLIPFMVGSCRQRTTRALDTLLQNVRTIGEEEQGLPDDRAQPPG